MAYPTITLDKPRRLKFGVTAAREYKRQFGVSLVSALSGMTREAADGRAESLLDLDQATNLLWATLRHEDKALTVDRVADLLERYLDNGGTLRELYEQINGAFNASAKAWGFEAVADEGKAETATEGTT